MRTRYRKFRPERGYIFNISIKDEEYNKKMATVVLRNISEPYPNELFTSWITRNAIKNFLQAPTFVNKYFPQFKNRLFNRDTDVYIDIGMAKTFGERMRLDTEKVFKTSLQSYSGYLADKTRSNTRNNLITICKIKGTYPRLKGLRYCPMCLKEKEYFKKEWRLLFHAVCPKHKCFLVDECPGCGEPISIIKRKRDIESFNCWNCGFIFKKAECEFLQAGTMADSYLKNTMKILENGYFERDGRQYYSIAYFIALKQIAKLIYNNGFRNSKLFSKECRLHGINVRPAVEAKSKSMEENISLKESMAVFTAAFEILGSTMKLENFIIRNEIRWSDLKRDMSYLPFWYERAIEKFSKQKYLHSHEEIRNAMEWMRRRGMGVSYFSLSRVFGTTLDPRKRPELRGFIY